MAKEKRIALGTLIGLDVAGGTTYKLVGLNPTLTPPGNTRAEIDGGVLDETFHVPLAGREDASEFTFTTFDDPADADHVALEGLFASQAEAAWILIYTQAPGPTSGSHSDAFSGRVINMQRQARDPNAPALIDFTVRRTGPITRADDTATPS